MIAPTNHEDNISLPRSSTLDAKVLLRKSGRSAMISRTEEVDASPKLAALYGLLKAKSGCEPRSLKNFAFWLNIDYTEDRCINNQLMKATGATEAC